jgi:hypothetical protein
MASLVEKSTERVSLDRPYLLKEKSMVIIDETLPHKLAHLYRRKRYNIGLRETLKEQQKYRLLQNRK